MTIPDTKIVLNIPSNALPENSSGCVIKLRLLPRKVFKDPALTFASNSSVVVELLPNNLILQHPAQLTIPHCLFLEEKKTPTAKIYMSHHQEGCSPCWEEQPGLEYSIGCTHCIVWIKSFCWVTVKFDDKDVLGKHLILYSCGEKLMPDHKYAVTAVGYNPDLDGESKFLKLNKTMIVSQRSPFVFMKEGSHPLTVLLVQYSPEWKLWSPKNRLDIAFEGISSSFEHICKFVFEKTGESAQSLACLYQAFQEKGQQAIDLTLRTESLDSHQDFGSQMRDSSRQTQEVEGNRIQNPELDESQQETSSQGRHTSSYDIRDAAVRPKIHRAQKTE
ncbi:hypothetical protein HOLleu_11404 [Holothuria leucospilota]|uniref:Netrin receptor UNC5 n=1 Tax=Holothuria leucospilota TaxID=206669 RepID=A0A9Q1HCA5_HOLLE|nr:hypothetical protein HOLleu_11404 [Holothuria leucospilota]